ncbi:MAG: hypothetical protein ACRCW1_05400 [Anaerotignaceae bacterium]
MNKQRRSSNIANIFSYDDAGNIVIKDYGQVTRYSWNGLIHGFVGPLSISSVSAATTDTDRFLVSDGGVLKYRTGVELLSDIGGVPSTRTLTINGVTQDLSADRTFTIAAGISGSGADGQIAYWNGTNSQTGSAGLVYSDSTGKITLSKNQNANTQIIASNTTIGTTSVAEVVLQSNTVASVGKASSGYAQYRTISSSDLYVYNAGAGDITIINDFATGKLKFAGGASSTVQMTLTAAGRLLLGTTSESTFLLDVNGTARVSGDLTILNNKLVIQNISNNTAPVMMSFINTGTGSGTGATFQFSYSSSLALTDGNGFTFIHNGSANTTSINSTGVSTLGSLNAATTLNFTSTVPSTIKSNGQSTDSFTYIGGGSLLFQNYIGSSYDTRFAILQNTGNVVIQNGGTFSDVASARLQVNSTTQGFLPPRMTTTQKNAIGTPAAGLVVYDNTDNYLSLYNGTNWQNIVSPNSAGNVLIGVNTDLGYKLQLSSAIYTTNGGINSDLNNTINHALYAVNQSLTSAASNGIIYLETTWNTTGNPSAIYLNVTNTASGSFSKLIDLRVGLTPVFQVDKAGGVFTGQPIGGSNGVWKFGQYNATAPSATGYVEVEVNGTLYKLLAST